MNKTLLTLCFLVSSLLHNNQAFARSGSQISEKPYLQESMVKVQLPEGGNPIIKKMIWVGQTVVAVSTDRVYLFNNGQWQSEKVPGDWQTATTDFSGRLWLGGIGSISAIDHNQINLPEEAKNDTVKSIVRLDAKSLLIGTNKGAWQLQTSRQNSQVTEQNLSKQNQTTKGDNFWARLTEFKLFDVRSLILGRGEEIWAATSGGLFHRIDGKWVNLSYALMAPGLGLQYFSLSPGTVRGDVYFSSQNAVGLISKTGDNQLWSGDNGLPYGPVTTIVQATSESISAAVGLSLSSSGKIQSGSASTFIGNATTQDTKMQNQNSKAQSQSASKNERHMRSMVQSGNEKSKTVSKPLNATSAPINADIEPTKSATEKEIWLGTPKGAICKRGESWRYYAGKRWLDNNRVNDILPIGAGRVWVATDAGINEIRRVPMTLGQKAAYFEKRLNERHLHHGFAAECRFKNPGDTTVFTHSTNDNDGLWTAIYLAAESFRYAVTGEKEAYDNAVRTFLAMEKLNTVTPIPGFVARSYVSIEESTGQGGEWHVSADGKWKWKGDTSSDEIVGHMFAYPLFYDLVAKGEMKERVRSLVDRIMTHIVDHNFEMVDLDGRATRWAVWNPDSLNHSQNWMYERGINSLQILAHLKAATYMTKNPKYDKAYDFLVREHHYLDNMLVQKMYGPYEINHSDDELSFLPYYILMRYGKNCPDSAVYRKSLDRSWRAEEGDQIPIWNYIASVGLGRNCGLQVAEEEMQQIPLDIRSWRMENSHRWDIRRSAIPDRFLKPQATKPIPTPERAVSKWNSNTYQLDAGGDGLNEDDGAYFLLPYWMARFHKLSEE